VRHPLSTDTPTPSYQGTTSTQQPNAHVHNHSAFQSHQAALPASQTQVQSPSHDNAGVVVDSDLWSTAYREAVARLGNDFDVGILEGKKVEQLFEELGKVDEEAKQDSAFLRGVQHLRAIQVPLERFKLALDLASPLTSIEPTTSLVCGVVRSVSAVSRSGFSCIFLCDVVADNCFLHTVDRHQHGECRSRLCEADRVHARADL
jgi:hypothetical protein